jgi:hypothetical protein
MDTIRTLAASSEFWAAIVGALVGGGLTAGGGVYVYRRQAIREVRVRIYEELVPKVPAGRFLSRGESAPRPDIGASIEKALDPIERLSHLAGWRDSRWVERLREKARPLLEYNNNETTINEIGTIVWIDEDAASRAEELLAEFEAEFDRFERWLCRRL